MALRVLDASGLSVLEFATREGMDPNRLYRWRSRLKGQAKDVPTFVEIVTPTLKPIEVVLRTGRVVRVANGFDAATMRRLVELLEQGSGEC